MTLLLEHNPVEFRARLKCLVSDLEGDWRLYDRSRMKVGNEKEGRVVVVMNWK